ncbi:MAG: hypothetical protein RI564_06695 [Gracilimonas sp.]|nr:hypothetical protein [Gracilimonas sp.]
MKNLFICSLLLILSVGLISCDSTTSPENPLSDSPAIESFDLSPTEVEFTLEDDGFKDTTVTISLNSLISNLNTDQNPQYAISSKSSGETVLEGELSPSKSQQYNFRAEANLPTTTTSIEDYIVNVFFEDNPKVYAQTGFSIQGFSNNPPEIKSVENPDEVEIPSSGSTPIQFKAKVTDEDGQNTIEAVYMRLISNSTGEVSGSPFQLLNDGQTSGDSGDETAQDSVFTLTLEISNANQPDTYDLEYYAIDRGDLVSDTVKSTLIIRE